MAMMDPQDYFGKRGQKLTWDRNRPPRRLPSGCLVYYLRRIPLDDKQQSNAVGSCRETNATRPSPEDALREEAE